MICRPHLGTAALALLVAGGVAAAPAGPGGRPAGGPPATGGPPVPLERTLVNPSSVTVFPFEKAPESKNAPPMLGEWIAGQIRTGLDQSGKYTAATYYPNSPLVLRARGQGISPEDIATVIEPQRGVINQVSALRIAAGMGTASAILGSVEDYTYTPQSNKVDVTATVQFLQVPSGTPIKTVGVSASATGVAGASQESVAQMAATEVAKKALSEMGVPAPSPSAMTGSKGKRDKSNQGSEPRRSSRKRGWLAVGALIGVLAVSVR